MTQPEQKDVTLEWYKNNIQVTRELSLFALKSLVTLNSGAFVVLLTFVGNAAAQSAYSVPITALQTAMYAFLTGIVLAFLVIAFAYVNSILMSPFDLKKGINDKIAIPLYVLGGLTSLASFVFGVVAIIGNVTHP